MSINTDTDPIWTLWGRCRDVHYGCTPTGRNGSGGECRRVPGGRSNATKFCDTATTTDARTAGTLGGVLYVVYSEAFR